MADPVLQPVAASILAPKPARWTLLSRILFRFAFVYLVFYCWPYAGKSNLFDAIPSFGTGALNDDDALGLTKIAEAPWRALSPWVAVHVFHLHGPVTEYHPTGSGDTTLDYVMTFCFAALAAFVAILWSLTDRRRANYRTLYAWLRLLVRFTLAFTMLSYGFAKVYPLQFPAPGVSILTEMYGESSPMGILWTFMGSSTAYTRFCGLVEVSAGLLLLFRRTSTLGALLAVGALLNVAVLNFCYDVPVKLYSTNLILMSLFLLIPNLKALARFFLLNQPARLEGIWVPAFERRWLRTGAVVLQALVIVSVLYNNVWGGYQSLKMYATSYYKRGPVDGVWNADAVGDLPWRQIAIQNAGRVAFRDIAGERGVFQAAFDEPKRDLKLTSKRLNQSGEFTYSQPDAQRLILRGNLNGKPVSAAFHRYDTSQFLLTNRGFHWISEDPFNR